MKEPGSLVYHKSTGLDRALEGYMKHQKSIRVSKDYTFITVTPENYNQQNRSLHLKRLQSAKPLSTPQKITISKQPSKKKREKNGKRGIT